MDREMMVIEGEKRRKRNFEEKGEREKSERKKLICVSLSLNFEDKFRMHEW